MRVRQLRLVVAAEDYEAAVAFYRDALGLPEQEAIAGPDGAHVTILDAGRATLELANPAQRRFIDRVEVGREGVAPRLRVAFEVDDGRARTAELVAAGATEIAPPTETPWRSLNSRLDAPAGLQVTLFEELGSTATEQPAPEPEPEPGPGRELRPAVTGRPAPDPEPRPGREQGSAAAGQPAPEPGSRWDLGSAAIGQPAPESEPGPGRELGSAAGSRSAVETERAARPSRVDGEVTVREAREADWPGIWRFLAGIVAAGETYTWDRDTPEDVARDKWMRGRTVVAVDRDGTVVGTAETHPNQAGGGAHVANAGFMVDPAHGGRGIGRLLAEHVLDQARADGYRAMQFNAVVETNTGAVALWHSLGFETVGTVPGAFDHPVHGPVALLVLHRAL